MFLIYILILLRTAAGADGEKMSKSLFPNRVGVVNNTHNRCTFEYSSWANFCSPSLNCTGNLQFLKRQTYLTIEKT